MSDIDPRDTYKRLNLSPDVAQDEIRRIYVQLRQKLDGDDLRLLHEAWETLRSPQNRARVDALLLQSDRTPPTLEELLTEISATADVDDWNQFVDQDTLLQSETARVTSLIIDRTWLGHAYSTLFTREAPVVEQHPLPQSTLTPVTRAARPVQAIEAPAVERPLPRWRPRWTTAWAGAALAALLLIFVLVRGAGLAGSNATTTPVVSSSAPHVAIAASVAAYDAPSRSFIIPTPTPYGQRPILVVQITPPPALTAPITSAALIDQLRRRLERTTEVVETDETDFARSIAFGAVEPAPLLPVASPVTLLPSSVSPQATPTASSTASSVAQPTSEPTPTATVPPTATPTATPTPTATLIPVLVQSRTFTNIRSGPGTEFDVVEILEPETSRQVLGRTASAAWLLIETTNGEGGWISTAVVDIDGDVGQIEIQD